MSKCLRFSVGIFSVIVTTIQAQIFLTPHEIWQKSHVGYDPWNPVHNGQLFEQFVSLMAVVDSSVQNYTTL